MTSSKTYTIRGVKIEFPNNAYPSQISMMDKVIRGCQKAQNCLLESPTGSGKTLALLCSALAWQKAESVRMKELIEAEVRENLLAQKKDKVACCTPESAGAERNQQEKCNFPMKGTVISDNDNNEEEDDDDVFVSQNPKRKCIQSLRQAENDDEIEVKSELLTQLHKCDVNVNANANANVNVNGNVTKQDDNTNTSETNTKYRIPKIYFGTRTHKQITQAVRELKKTAFKRVESCVLSSRNYSCIHPYASKANVNATELCQQLLDPTSGTGCLFHQNSQKFNHPRILKDHGLTSIWDIEDLIQFGRRKSTCPYYTARSLTLSSDIIFCPYNYLVDPLIRKSMNIRLNGEIIILDEAHNIEDVCRESASYALNQLNLLEAIRDCNEVIKCTKNESKTYTQLNNILSKINNWIDGNKDNIVDFKNYKEGTFIMTGVQAVDSFEEFGFGPSSFSDYQNCVNTILAERQKDQSNESNNFNNDNGNGNGNDNDNNVTITSSTKGIMEGLLLMFSLLFQQKYTSDYHVALIKSMQHADGHWKCTLHFWCLNSATVFNELKESARCIILTSGTLAPINSFQSELGAEFPIKLEANHVIDRNQCWVSSLAVGPTGVLLNGTFDSTSSYAFQDELGELLVCVCSVVPHGVLCFLPSYSLLTKLYDRWNDTGLLNRINAHKNVICEPRRQEEFDSLMKSYYDCIESCEKSVVGKQITGMLLLAVCRGKVSEGMDFADNNARLVITVGIPFPNAKDSQVLLKKSYNDKNKLIKGLLSGRDWYQIQAFRALNQALGRCIRHRNDWGAILLVDNRFAQPGYTNGLSKWVRNYVQHHNEWNAMYGSLQKFVSCSLKCN